MKYNYLEEVKKDVMRYIEENVNLEEYAGERDRLEEELNDSLWIEDSVTGNGSGSYTFNNSRAKEYVLADMDTVTEALREFCTEAKTIAEKFLSEDWEYFDVTARCYVLGSAIYEVLEELENEGAFEVEAEEEETAESAISAAAATMNGMMEGFEKTFQRSAENATGAVTA